MANVIYFPTRTDWIKPRTDDIDLTSENCQIIVPHNLDKVVKVLWKVPTAEYNVTVYWGDEIRRVVRIDTLRDGDGNAITQLDVSAFVVEKKYWDTLGLVSLRSEPIDDVTLAKNNTCYYAREGDIITLNVERYKVNSVFSYTAFATMIQYALEQFRIEHGLQVGVEGSWVNVTGVGKDPQYNTLPAIIDFQFRVGYEAITGAEKIIVDKSDTQDNTFLQPFSQTQPVLNSSTFGKNLRTTVDRTGVEKRTIMRRVKHLSQVRKIGSFWREKGADGTPTGNIWRLTAQEVVYQATCIIVTETWSKNYSYLSEYVGVKKVFRSGIIIPDETHRRTLNYRDVCLLTEANDLTFANDSILTDFARQSIFEALVTNATDKECTNAIWDDVYPTFIGVVAKGVANSLVFTATPKDNRSVGRCRVEVTDTTIFGDDKVICPQVLYDENGSIETAHVSFIAGLSNFGSVSSDYYPHATGAEPTNVIVDNVEFIVKKSGAEKTPLTYQVDIKTDNVDLIIGDGFAENCPLVKDRTSGNVLQYWQLTKEVPKNCKTVTSYYGITTDEPTVDVHAVQGYFVIQPHTAVTDEKGNLIIAYNGNSEKTFRAVFFHDDGDVLARAYRRLYDGVYKDGINNQEQE